MHRIPTAVVSFAVLACFAAPAMAQVPDMVAVGWNGQVVALDSQRGTSAPLATGPMGMNALARTGNGELWSTARTGSSFSFFLTRVDAVAGNVAFAWPSLDLRGLAEAGPTALWGVETQPNGAPSRLWRIDTQTGVHSLIGGTGRAAIQSLAVQGGVLYGWHWVDGLVTIDPVTGQSSDPFPAVASNLVIQWLAADPRSGLIGGTSGGLVHIDTTTGIATFGPGLPGGFDLRGAEFASFALPYGSGCSVGNGELRLGASGSLQPRAVVTLTSHGHVAGSLRGVVFGFDRDSYRGVRLPLSLDPLFGTQGCSLYTSIDFSQLLLGSGFPASSMALPLPLPPRTGVLDLFVQHFDLALPWNLPGSSNGLHLHIQP